MWDRARGHYVTDVLLVRAVRAWAAADQAGFEAFAARGIDVLLRAWAGSIAAEPRLRLRVGPPERQAAFDADDADFVELDRAVVARGAGDPIVVAARSGPDVPDELCAAVDVLGRVYGAVRDAAIDRMLELDEIVLAPVSERHDLAATFADDSLHWLLMDFYGEEQSLLLEASAGGRWHALRDVSDHLAAETSGPNGWRRRFCRHAPSRFDPPDDDEPRAVDPALEARLEREESISGVHPAFAHAPSSLRLPDSLCAVVRDVYASSGRAYHTIDHVAEVARWFARWDAWGETWHHPKSTYLALLFHDAIYVPGASDNEERSAVLARETIAATMPRAAIDVTRVAALIRLTAKHGRIVPAEIAAEPDAPAFLDCDMAILGADGDAFDAYDAAIAREYSHLPTDAYRAGRGAFLEQLLGSPRIFLTEPFHQRLDARARANLRRAIARL